MNHIRRGDYSRDSIPKSLRFFAPTKSLYSIEQVDLEALWESGKRLILLDVDNTLMAWKSEEVPEATTAWLDKARGLGFKFCVLSNTRNPGRLNRVCGALGVEYIRDRFKPSRRMFLMALAKYNVLPKAAVMIGDQLFTDVLGANRTDIDAIWVRPIGKREFIGTSILSRNLERIAGAALYRYFQPHEGDIRDTSGFFRSGVLRSFVKFVGAGVISSVIDLGCHWALMNKAYIGGVKLTETVGRWAIANFHEGWPIDPQHLTDAAFAPLKIGPVCLAILNSYFLNRAIATFDHQDKKASVGEGAKFFIIAGLAALVNIGAASFANHLLEGSVGAKFAFGSFVGMAAGFLVNFNGQRIWTFSQRKAKST